VPVLNVALITPEDIFGDIYNLLLIFYKKYYIIYIESKKKGKFL